MPAENPQAIAYERLVTLAQEQTDDLEAIQNLVRVFARAILAALHVGLTPDEIRAACREGMGTETQVTLDPSLDPEYWLRVYAEAESFWASRSGYGNED
ncbi:MAG: hypothetical protein K8L91_27095 [Anaerolineae bacterium]|nr:hypothetical protein [Anaerolineae bacterium]